MNSRSHYYLTVFAQFTSRREKQLMVSFSHQSQLCFKRKFKNFIYQHKKILTDSLVARKNNLTVSSRKWTKSGNQQQ